MNRIVIRGVVALAAAAAATAVTRRGLAAPTINAKDLAGKTAVVTGAGSGIGRSLARLLAHRGALVHVADLNTESAGAVAQEIRDAGGSAVAHTVDVAEADAVARLADGVFADGPVDLLFNNAGIGHAGAITETPSVTGGTSSTST